MRTNVFTRLRHWLRLLLTTCWPTSAFARHLTAEPDPSRSHHGSGERTHLGLHRQATRWSPPHHDQTEPTGPDPP